MPRRHSRTTSSVRVLEDSGREDSAFARWTAQLLVGGLPGILVCGVIMWIASRPASDSSGTHIASIIPLLSANGLVDSPAFHRLQEGKGSHQPQFRLPEKAKTLPSSSDPVPTVGPLFGSAAPRTAWHHLGGKVRAQIDAGLAKQPDWERVLLHGSGVNHGSAKLLNRYQGSVRGLTQGMAYHFVIGNGAGSGDGSVEIGSRWLNPAAEHKTSAPDKNISVCLVGDFNEQAPTKAQLEAVRELMDYLSIKLSRLELTFHRADDGSTSPCLGTKFAGWGGL